MLLPYHGKKIEWKWTGLSGNGAGEVRSRYNYPAQAGGKAEEETFPRNCICPDNLNVFRRFSAGFLQAAPGGYISCMNPEPGRGIQKAGEQRRKVVLRNCGVFQAAFTGFPARYSTGRVSPFLQSSGKSIQSPDTGGQYCPAPPGSYSPR